MLGDINVENVMEEVHEEDLKCEYCRKVFTIVKRGTTTWDFTIVSGTTTWKEYVSDHQVVINEVIIMLKNKNLKFLSLGRSRIQKTGKTKSLMICGMKNIKKLSVL